MIAPSVPSRIRSAIARPWLIIASLLSLLVLPAEAASRRGPIPPEQLDFFEKKIRPILANHCYECHSEEKDTSRGDLVLDTRDGLRSGGERGPGVVPGKPDDSILIRAIRQEGRLRMPPDNRGGPLSDEVIADFEKWVEWGAPDPRLSSKVETREPARPDRPVDWDKEREFWAFQKPRLIPQPEVADRDWPRTEVDRFVRAKQEEKSLQPAPDADRPTLARRLYQDLTGLPPTPDQLDDFVYDSSPRAYERLVDDLLASPHFGEHWGRQWLDVARYGESSGLDRNLNFPYAYRYRNYVIDAFNTDKPYDQFIVEQLAGDLLPAVGQSRRDELTIATGFLAVGPKGLNETRPKYFKYNVIDDQIDVTSRAFLGLTVSCARCHDHKVDPIPTRDYYSLAGIFASTDTLHGTVGGRGNRKPTPLLGLAGLSERPILFGNGPTPNNTVNTNTFFAALQRTNTVAEGTNAGDTSTNTVRRSRRERPPRPTNSVPVERVPAREPYAMGVREQDEPMDSPIYFRGDLSKARDVVPRGFLRILNIPDAPEIPEESSGRLQLAQWITHPDNPLVARVLVNRVWQQLFGEGIVATADNFGKFGSAPTHPELLDFLAIQFVEDHRWSIKRLVRSLVLTRTYQLSSQPDAQALEVDPENTLLWRASPRRLKAEAIRDAILVSSGRLEIDPPVGSVTADFGDGYYGDNIWPHEFPFEYPKRSVYLPLPRDLVPESLALFDFPNPGLVVARRENSISPSQALYLMNNPFVRNEAIHFARRLLTLTEVSDATRIREAYRLALQRQPSDEEIRRARSFLQEQTRNFIRNGILTPNSPFSAEEAPEDGDAESGETPTGPRTRTRLIPSQSLRADGTPREWVERTEYVIEVAAPASPQEAAYALFTQAIFASAEFRHLH